MSRNSRREKKPTAEMKLLSESIRVSPITSKNNGVPGGVPLRIFGNRRNFKEFRSVYEPALKEIYTAPKVENDTSKSLCSLDPCICPFRNLKQLSIPESEEEIFIVTCPKPIKTVRVEEPKRNNNCAIVKVKKPMAVRSSTTTQTVIKRPVNRSNTVAKMSDKSVGSTHEFIEKLKALEKCSEVESGDLIEQANKEITIASSQIEQIQDLLKAKLSEIKGEKAQKSSGDKPKWNTKRHKNEESFNIEKNKVLIALNTLNRKLQKMQDKYFKQPRIRYKSVSEATTKSVEFLYKNNNFERITPSKIDYIDKSIITPRLQVKRNTTDFRRLVLSELRKDFENDKVKKTIPPDSCVEPQSDSTLFEKKRETRAKSALDPVDDDDLPPACLAIPPETPPTSVDVWTCNDSNTSSQKQTPRDQTPADRVSIVNVEQRRSKDKETSPPKVEDKFMNSSFLAREFSQPIRNSPVASPYNIPPLQPTLSLQSPNDYPSWELGRLSDKMERGQNLQSNIDAALRNSIFTNSGQ